MVGSIARDEADTIFREDGHGRIVFLFSFRTRIYSKLVVVVQPNERVSHDQDQQI